MAQDKISDLKQAIADIEDGLQSPVPLPAAIKTDMANELKRLKVDLSNAEEHQKESAKKKTEAEAKQKAAKAEDQARKAESEEKKATVKTARVMKLKKPKTPVKELGKKAAARKTTRAKTAKTTSRSTRKSLPKSVKKFNRGRDLTRDAGRQALPPGQRISKTGHKYTENRPGHADISPRHFLRKGGQMTVSEKEKFAKIMGEFRDGTLTSHGKKVKNRQQALAIAFSEAGISLKKKSGGSLSADFTNFIDKAKKRTVSVYNSVKKQVGAAYDKAKEATKSKPLTTDEVYSKPIGYYTYEQRSKAVGPYKVRDRYEKAYLRTVKSPKKMTTKEILKKIEQLDDKGNNMSWGESEYRNRLVSEKNKRPDAPKRDKYNAGGPLKAGEKIYQPGSYVEKTVPRFGKATIIRRITNHPDLADAYQVYTDYGTDAYWDGSKIKLISDTSPRANKYVRNEDMDAFEKEIKRIYKKYHDDGRSYVSAEMMDQFAADIYKTYHAFLGSPLFAGRNAQEYFIGNVSRYTNDPERTFIIENVSRYVPVNRYDTGGRLEGYAFKRGDVVD